VSTPPEFIFIEKGLDRRGVHTCLARKPRGGVSRARRGRRSASRCCGIKGGLRSSRTRCEIRQQERPQWTQFWTALRRRNLGIWHRNTSDDGATAYRDTSRASGIDVVIREVATDTTLSCIVRQRAIGAWSGKEAGTIQRHHHHRPSPCSPAKDRSKLGRRWRSSSFVNCEMRCSALSARRSASIARRMSPAFSVAS